MHSHVGGRLELLVVPQHRKRFVPERGEGREPAEQTDEHERPRLWSKQLAGVGQSADHADQGSQREGHEGCVSLYQSAQPIAGERTEEPTGADRRCIDQSRFHRLTPGGWRGRNAWSCYRCPDDGRRRRLRRSVGPFRGADGDGTKPVGRVRVELEPALPAADAAAAPFRLTGLESRCVVELAREPAAGWPWRAFASFIDLQNSTLELCAVKSGDGFLNNRRVAELDKRESPRLAGCAINRQEDFVDVADLRKERFEF